MVEAVTSSICLKYDAYITALRGGGSFAAELRAYERAYVVLDVVAKEEWDREVERTHDGADRADPLDPTGRSERISAALIAHHEKKRCKASRDDR